MDTMKKILAVTTNEDIKKIVRVVCTAYSEYFDDEFSVDGIDDSLFTDPMLDSTLEDVFDDIEDSVFEVPETVSEEKEDTIKWEEAEYTRKTYTEEEKKSFRGLKKAIVVLILAGLGITAYNLGYIWGKTNSKAFWADTNTRLEERHREEMAMDEITQKAIEKNIAKQEGEDR